MKHSNRQIADSVPQSKQSKQLSVFESLHDANAQLTKMVAQADTIVSRLTGEGHEESAHGERLNAGVFSMLVDLNCHINDLQQLLHQVEDLVGKNPVKDPIELKPRNR